MVNRSSSLVFARGIATVPAGDRPDENQVFRPVRQPAPSPGAGPYAEPATRVLHAGQPPGVDGDGTDHPSFGPKEASCRAFGDGLVQLGGAGPTTPWTPGWPASGAGSTTSRSRACRRPRSARAAGSGGCSEGSLSRHARGAEAADRSGFGRALSGLRDPHSRLWRRQGARLRDSRHFAPLPERPPSLPATCWPSSGARAPTSR